MYDTRPVHLGQRVRDGQRQGLEPPGGQRAVVGHMLLDRGTRDELADDVRVSPRQIGVEDPCGGQLTDPARRAELPAYAGERDLVVLLARQQEFHHDLVPRPVPGEPHHTLPAPAELALANVSAHRQLHPRIHAPAPSPAPGSWPPSSVSAALQLRASFRVFRARAVLSGAAGVYASSASAGADEIKKGPRFGDRDAAHWSHGGLGGGILVAAVQAVRTGELEIPLLAASASAVANFRLHNHVVPRRGRPTPPDQAGSQYSPYRERQL